MTSQPFSFEKAASKDFDFSLVLGGPLYQIFRRANLSGTALELLHRRIIILVLITWAPLLILSAWEGNAWGQQVTIPFFRDFNTHARLLVALPLLLVAELVVFTRMRNVVALFIDRDLVPQAKRAQFENAVLSAQRLRNSITAEVTILVFIYTVGVFFIWRKLVEVDGLSWRGLGTSGVLDPSLAGWWFGLVSLPIFQFLLFRWYYRLFIWGRFLWQVSRIKLDLVPTHPDRSGGIGFLSNISYAYVPLLLAQGTLLSGMMANRIVHAGGRLPDFQVDIFALVGGAVVIVLAPLLFFSPQLAQAKRTGRREYGNLAQRYVREFDQKWLRSGAPKGEEFIGSADIQSLADLGNSYNAIREMKWLPFTARTIMQLGITTLVPLAPLLLTVFPLDELLSRLIQIVF